MNKNTTTSTEFTISEGAEAQAWAREYVDLGYSPTTVRRMLTPALYTERSIELVLTEMQTIEYAVTPYGIVPATKWANYRAASAS